MAENIRMRTRYAIMPTSFHTDFFENTYNSWQRNSFLSDGSTKPYPPWKNVDSVLIPVCTLNDHWFLIQYKVVENEVIIFDRKRSAVPEAFMNMLLAFYKRNILWFYRQLTNTTREPIPVPAAHEQPRMYFKTVMQYPDCHQNSGLFMCMFIHYLVKQDDDMVISDVSDEQITHFRKTMADIFYAKRIE